MEKETPAWQRIKIVIKESGMTVNAFAYHIGLKRSENLYQIKRGNHGVSRELANLINQHYPQFSIGWLLTGEGDNGVSEDPNELKVRNEVFKNITVFERVPRESDTTSPTVIQKLYLPLSIVRNSEFALNNIDEAMNPKIPLGAMILVHEHAGSIVYGKMYVIQTVGYTIIRTIRKTNRQGYVRLTNSQPKHYDDIIIEKEEITKLYSIDYILAEVV
ncbi:MAG: S24 family peptidase [Rikenellaceae bacterium]|nr:S24 family peptidase [Rikenellaceae bacterium]